MASAPWVKIGLVQANVSQAVKIQGPRYADRIIGRMWPLTLGGGRAGGRLRGLARGGLAVGALAVARTSTRWPRISSRSGRPTSSSARPPSAGCPRPEGRVAQVENSAFLLAPTSGSSTAT